MLSFRSPRPHPGDPARARNPEIGPSNKYFFYIWPGAFPAQMDKFPIANEMEFAGATFSLPKFSVRLEGEGRAATQESADLARQVPRPQAAAITCPRLSHSILSLTVSDSVALDSDNYPKLLLIGHVVCHGMCDACSVFSSATPMSTNFR